MTIAPTTTGAGASPPSQDGGRPNERLPAHRLVARATGSYIARIQPQYLSDTSAAVAELARLRRGAGKRVHQVQDLWGVGGTEELARLLDGRKEFIRLEYAEEAVFLASTLWALHQQSGRDAGMHDPRQHLGGAVRALIRLKGASGEDEEDSPLRKRLVRVGTAESLDSVAVRLREIVLLLRGAREPLDYARLAGQLYRWQHRPDRAGVQREWGREFHLAAASASASVAVARKGKPSSGVDTGDTRDTSDTGDSGDSGDAIDRALAPDEEFGGYAAGE
ncbi:type I-E CRISPR-associated protein Cse2/CasB [Streptomyces sp. NBC_01116]|uniref:type I-E CRISPR-associated protein Cse2/CasB n=1 Tax=Streptomyces sp. NBC_01116 TaxID=2903752 RepID=UPI003247191B